MTYGFSNVGCVRRLTAEKIEPLGVTADQRFQVTLFDDRFKFDLAFERGRQLLSISVARNLLGTEPPKMLCYELCVEERESC